MAEATEHVMLAGGETGEKTEFNTYQTNATITSTAGEYNAGSYGHKLDYNFVVTNGDNNVVTEAEWVGLRSYKCHAWKVDLKISAAPGAVSNLLRAGGVTLKIATDRKLYVDSESGTKSAALSTGTWYRVEMLVDANTNKAYVRIDGNDEFNVAVTNSAQTSANIGEDRKSVGGVDPAFIAYMDDICFWYSESGTDTEPKWWGDTQLHYRTVDANGDYTDFTNTYTAVDDYAPKDDADYNQGGAMNSTERETHNPANATVSNTLKGFMWLVRVLDDLNTSVAERAPSKLLVRDGSTDYEWTVLASTSIRPQYAGYETRPDGTTLTNAALNDMEAGQLITMDYVTTTIASPLPITISEAKEVVFGTSDGIDDGSWTDTGGGTAYTEVDSFSSSSDYIESSTNGHKQSFGQPTPTSSGIKIGSVRPQFRAGKMSGSGTTTCRMFFIHDPTGTPTYYYTNTVTVGLGTVHYFPDEWQSNPHTGNPWTAAEIDAGEFGIELVDIADASSVRVYGLGINVANVSQTRMYAMHMVTASGDAWEALPSAVAAPVQQLSY